MNKLKKLLSCLLILLLMIGSVNAVMAKEKQQVKAVDASDSTTVYGVVSFNNLEGGFYEIDGLRLTGNFDFEQYEGKRVKVTGVEDNSPSIFMTRALQVHSIELVKDNAIAVQLLLRGIVSYNNLEGGFYEVCGYRLTGDMKFDSYNNKIVIVKGELDTSPSIYMTRAVKVNSIKVTDAAALRGELESKIIAVQDRILYISNNMQSYIDKYGSDSDEVKLYYEELGVLGSNLERLKNELSDVISGKYDLELILLDGTVSYNNLESGFYEVCGYRLAGGFSLKRFEGKRVLVTGIEDTSPGIFMTKALLIYSIELVNADNIDEKDGNIDGNISDLVDMFEQSLKQLQISRQSISKLMNLFKDDLSITGFYKKEFSTLITRAESILKRLVEFEKSGGDVKEYKKLRSILRSGENRLRVFKKLEAGF